MTVVMAWTEFGHSFAIERLAEPRRIGATTRHYRLYDNGTPALGGQWHSRASYAVARANYITQCEYSSRVAWLEQRVATLENQLLAQKRAA